MNPQIFSSHKNCYTLQWLEQSAELARVEAEPASASASGTRSGTAARASFAHILDCVGDQPQELAGLPVLPLPSTTATIAAATSTGKVERIQ